MKRIYKAGFLTILQEANEAGWFSWRDIDDICKRCYEGFFRGGKCRNCGMAQGRVVRRIRRKHIGGKYGRNSGKVQSQKA